MLIGEVVTTVTAFMRHIAAKDYDAAVAMGQRMDDFLDGLVELYGDLLDDFGEMPPDGWKHLWIQGPIDTPQGLIVNVDAPVYDRSGEDMDWFLKFTLIPGYGEAWRIDYVRASN